MSGMGLTMTEPAPAQVATGEAKPGANARRGLDGLAPRNLDAVAQVATRTSEFVRFMKVGIPLAAVILAGTMVIWPQFQKRDEGFRVTFTTVPQTNEALTMEKPRYQGLDQRNRPYLVTAERAIQDPGDNRLISLDHPQGDMTASDGSWITLAANNGIYNQETRLLMLQGDINIYSDRGIEFHALSAELDLGNSTVASDEKVWGHGAFGAIRANGLRVWDKGSRIEFINGVKTRVEVFRESKGGKKRK